MYSAVVTLAVRFFDRPKVFVPEAPVSAMPQAEQLTAAQVLYAIGASTTVEVDVHLQVSKFEESSYDASS
jgi:hypothetical protein